MVLPLPAGTRNTAILRRYDGVLDDIEDGFRQAGGDETGNLGLHRVALADDEIDRPGQC